MSYRFLCVFALLFSFCSISLFSQNIQNENGKSILIEHLDASHKVILYAPSAVKAYSEGKVYLDESKVYKSETGSYLCLANGEILLLPVMPRDSHGRFLVALSMVDSKAFKCICNKCGYKWDGGVFSIRCPECKSTDIGFVPNW